jgi:hypothetical protein
MNSTAPPEEFQTDKWLKLTIKGSPAGGMVVKDGSLIAYNRKA